MKGSCGLSIFCTETRIRPACQVFQDSWSSAPGFCTPVGSNAAVVRGRDVSKERATQIRRAGNERRQDRYLQDHLTLFPSGHQGPSHSSLDFDLPDHTTPWRRVGFCLRRLWSHRRGHQSAIGQAAKIMDTARYQNAPKRSRYSCLVASNTMPLGGPIGSAGSKKKTAYWSRPERLRSVESTSPWNPRPEDM